MLKCSDQLSGLGILGNLTLTHTQCAHQNTEDVCVSGVLHHCIPTHEQLVCLDGFWP